MKNFMLALGAFLLLVACLDTTCEQYAGLFYRVKNGSFHRLENEISIDTSLNEDGSIGYNLHLGPSTSVNNLQFVKSKKYSIDGKDYMVDKYYHNHLNTHDDELVVYIYNNHVITLDVLKGGDIVNATCKEYLLLHNLIMKDPLNGVYDFMGQH